MPPTQASHIASHNGVVRRLFRVSRPAVMRHNARGDGNGGGGNHGKSRDDNDDHTDSDSDCDNGHRRGNGSHRFRRNKGPRPCGDQKGAYPTDTIEGASPPTGMGSPAPSASPSTSRFSPLAAGFIGALLSFVTVSAIVWGAYFFVRRRRARARARRAKAAHPPPRAVDACACQRALTPVPLMAAHLPSSRAASPMPYFVNGRDAGTQEKAAEAFNPFVHPQDPRGVDPFAEPYEWKPSNAHPSHTLSA